MTSAGGPSSGPLGPKGPRPASTRGKCQAISLIRCQLGGANSSGRISAVRGSVAVRIHLMSNKDAISLPEQHSASLSCSAGSSYLVGTDSRGGNADRMSPNVRIRPEAAIILRYVHKSIAAGQGRVVISLFGRGSIANRIVSFLLTVIGIALLGASIYAIGFFRS